MTSISFGEAIRAGISVPGEEDTYTLDLAAGDQVYLAVADFPIFDDFRPFSRISSDSNITEKCAAESPWLQTWG